ncbi:MAG: hypothetical protein ACRES0_32960, partial [Pseudomonas sp.]
MRLPQVGAALRDRWWQFGLGWGITGDRPNVEASVKEEFFMNPEYCEIEQIDSMVLSKYQKISIQ